MRYSLVSVLALLLVAACGESRSDRAISGGAIGAGVGGVVGAVTGSPLTGAVLGGAAGAGTGALTDEDDINLGDPVWNRGDDDDDDDDDDDEGLFN